MAFYPKIDSLCPYKGELSEILDDDICRLCKREVFDLTDMSDADREIFFKSCDGEVCVSYKLPMGRAFAAAVVTTSGVLASTAAMAQENTYCDMIIVGGIKDPSHVQKVELDIDKSIPMLPVVFEDDTVKLGVAQAKTTATSAASLAQNAKKPVKKRPKNKADAQATKQENALNKDDELGLNKPAES